MLKNIILVAVAFMAFGTAAEAKAKIKVPHLSSSSHESLDHKLDREMGEWNATLPSTNKNGVTLIEVKREGKTLIIRSVVSTISPDEVTASMRASTSQQAGSLACGSMKKLMERGYSVRHDDLNEKHELLHSTITNFADCKAVSAYKHDDIRLVPAT